ncbi:MAG: hypothetical protein IJX77_03625 [Ruminococcus sp.]|nr:hypothetical protein [Ruminococcus sp.]
MPPLKDLTGKTFNRLTVIRRDTSRDGVYWICRCDCGREVSVRAYNLTSGSTKSCGCLNNELIHKKQRNSIDLIGHRYGDLEVLEYVDSDRSGTRWRCKCHRCGRTTTVTAAWLKDYKSCGCAATDAGRKNVQTYKEAVAQTGTNPERWLSDKPNANNKTGIKGVCYLERTGTYVAYITFQGERKTLKRSKDINVCIAARREAEKHLDNFIKWYVTYKKADKE